MAEIAADRAFADAFALEDETIESAREAADRFGIDPVSPATGAALALVAATGGSTATIIEIGTGTGVSGLWLLRGAPEAQLTSIDADPDLHLVARGVFAAARPTRPVRLITGTAAALLPRMNERAYDVVLIDANADEVRAHFDEALRLVRPGGSVLVTHVLQEAERQTPAEREAYEGLLAAVREDERLLAAVIPVADGLLHVVAR